MTRPLLGILDELGKTAVQLPATRRIGGTVGGRREQRMRKVNPIVVELDQVSADSRLEDARGRAAHGRDEVNRRLRERRGRSERRERLRRQSIQPKTDELVDPRQALAGLEPSAPRFDRARELEREERIATGRRVDALQRRPGEGDAEPVA